MARVYAFANKPENLGLYQQPGEHGPTADDIEFYFDFFDRVFGRKSAAKTKMWVNGYTFQKWKTTTNPRIDVAKYRKRALGDFFLDDTGAPFSDVNDWYDRRKSIRQTMLSTIGDGGPAIQGRVSSTLRAANSSSLYPDVLFTAGKSKRPISHPKGQNMAASRVRYGDNITGHLYHWADDDGKPLRHNMPVVIWLHPYNYAAGYSRNVGWPFALLTQYGFAVLALDQIGFGPRVEQAKDFYDRYPKWSLMGRMVADTRASIDALLALDLIDPCRIYVMGSSLGAKVALYTAALDRRIAGLAVACGFAPLRVQTENKGCEGVKHYSHLHGLIPKFGFFEGHQDRLPTDYDEILAMVAPRPLYMVAPTLDRYHPVEDVRQAVQEVRKVYRLFGREEALTLETPSGFNAFDINWQPNWQGATWKWLVEQAEVESFPWKIPTEQG